MRTTVPLMILCCSIVPVRLVAQTQPSQPSRGSAAQSSVPKFGPDSPVLTIRGLCENRPPIAHLGQPLPPLKNDTTAIDCQSVLTRSRFENLVNALNPNTPPDKRRRFAMDYSDIALYAQQAQQLGLDKTAEFQELAKFKYMDALGMVYKHYIQQLANAIPDSEVEKYYKEHSERFEEFGLKRIFVPKGKLQAGGYPSSPSAEDQAEMKKVADRLRKAAADGGDFDKLQDEAYLAAGDKESALTTDLGAKWTRDNMPAGYQKVVLGMQPGQIADPVLFGDGWYIFKLVSRQMIPIGEARETMEGLLINDLVKSLKGSIKPEVNRAYFGGSESGSTEAPESVQ